MKNWLWQLQKGDFPATLPSTMSMGPSHCSHLSSGGEPALVPAAHWHDSKCSSSAEGCGLLCVGDFLLG